MANPDQKTILYDEVYKKVNEICTDFQVNCGATDDEVKELLREILAKWEKIKRYNKK